MKKALTIICLLACYADASAAPLFMYPQQDLVYGEAAIYVPGTPGYIDVDAATGAVATQNAAVLVAPTRGAVIIEGNELVPIVFSAVAGAPACDVTYINPCLGAPSFTVTHTFGGEITGNYCPKRPKCQDTLYFGGRFAFTGIEEGRWTTTITITANYQ